ncbi:MAG: 4Fe-4S dicluster domain-containing protein [Candidatus Parvarchaeota archaeon]|nr:4Fe-4S dicluster domain-containing protein [Candidatus Jingweiarchaeum tengchongense]MCW1298171.1 4Fe-4S dicluster domain-containing protein [Candidatus Jingweiarchaeum tengchongense]MCW1299969.1 4Fe-4S dicluster domain-containing protein [Candidatus Jingweiarchaeum tengchongense]MCW1305046.1 4Fe-4S dicluster domain-containing protein [Candidatus Jingweiarchaeum tengchongense]MCW1309651.1 4Fe-4S dicluster domain-containing protein [Candidatus Jingweiarchaeum tengchongense]
MSKQAWFPIIYLDKCDGCGGTYRCVNFCPHNVLEIRDNKAYVANPLNCIYGCSSCENLCPNDAIIFPPRETSYVRSEKKDSLLHKIICKSCKKEVTTNRETEYCFDCESKLEKELR